MFVNQIGALHREWQDQFPLSHLACYVLFQKDQKDVREALLSNSDFELLSRNIGQDWRGVIAALHFGVPVRRHASFSSEARSRLLSMAEMERLWLIFSRLTIQVSGLCSKTPWPAEANDWSSLAPSDLAKLLPPFRIAESLIMPTAVPKQRLSVSDANSGGIDTGLDSI